MAPQAQPEPLFRLDSVSPALRAELDDISAEIPIDEGGGSSLTKMLVLASLIIGNGFTHVAEIGVYRGRVFVALAAIMRALGRGEVTGIDPYTAEAAIQRDDHHIGTDLRIGRTRSIGRTFTPVCWGRSSGADSPPTVSSSARPPRVRFRVSRRPASTSFTSTATTIGGRSQPTSRSTSPSCG